MFLTTMAAAVLAVAGQNREKSIKMYGLIGKITATAGRRDDLIAILQQSSGGMPGCLSYVIAKDAADENSIWVTEVWNSEADHEASLSLPAVKDALIKAKPLIAGFARVAVTNPVAGVNATK